MGGPALSDRPHLITCQADVDEGAAWLAAHAPGFGQILEQTGQLPLRLRPDGFAGLADIIISQQVSVASASAIRSRVERAGFLTEDAVRAASEADLRGVGLSRPKVRYLQALAEAKVDYFSLREMTDAQVEARLTELTGIGPWTSQIYAMFAMGRRDVFAPGDLALQIAAA